MVVDDQYPHDDLVLIRTAVASSSYQERREWNNGSKIEEGGSLPVLFGLPVLKCVGPPRPDARVLWLPIRREPDLTLVGI
jgi:hypothetical protein